MKPLPLHNPLSRTSVSQRAGERRLFFGGGFIVKPFL
jgi:hypothetical protein